MSSPETGGYNPDDEEKSKDITEEEKDDKVQSTSSPNKMITGVVLASALATTLANVNRYSDYDGPARSSAHSAETTPSGILSSEGEKFEQLSEAEYKLTQYANDPESSFNADQVISWISVLRQADFQEKIPSATGDKEYDKESQQEMWDSRTNNPDQLLMKIIDGKKDPEVRVRALEALVSRQEASAHHYVSEAVKHGKTIQVSVEPSQIIEALHKYTNDPVLADAANLAFLEHPEWKSPVAK